jgi:hypothetical protein
MRTPSPPRELADLATAIRGRASRLPLVATALAVVASGCHGHDGDEAEHSRGRLLVADGVGAAVQVVDLDTHEVVGRFEVGAGAQVFAGAESLYGWVIAGAPGMARAVRSGIDIESHGDHFHVEKGPPTLLDLGVPAEGARAHAHNDGHASLFAAASGELVYVQERTVSAGGANVVRVDSGAPHRGGGVVALGHVLVTRPTDVGGEVSPMGVTIRTAADPATVVTTVDDCALAADAAANGSFAVFGCRGAALVVERGAAGLTARTLPLAGGATEPVRALRTRAGATTAVGVLGADALALVDVGAGAVTRVPLPAAYRAHAYDLRGERVLVLTADGVLRSLDARTLAEGPTATVIAGGADEAAALAVGPDRAYVSDPAAGLLRVVQLDTMSALDPIPVGGRPTGLAAFSLSPDWRDATWP